MIYLRNDVLAWWHTWVMTYLRDDILAWWHTGGMPYCKKVKRDRQMDGQKMTKKRLKMTQNDTKNDWKWNGWLKSTWKIWKKVKVTVNDQKWQSVIKRKKWQKTTKCHKRDLRNVLKLMWYLVIYYSTFELLKKAKNVKCDRRTDRHSELVTYKVACKRTTETF